MLKREGVGVTWNRTNDNNGSSDDAYTLVYGNISLLSRKHNAQKWHLRGRQGAHMVHNAEQGRTRSILAVHKIMQTYAMKHWQENSYQTA